MKSSGELLKERNENIALLPSETFPLPYQDRHTALLPDEVWRDVTGYEGYYQVSNLGRIKSLDRVIPHPRIGKQTVRGRLLTQKVAINKNTIHPEKMVDLQVSLSLEGKQHFRNIRRWSTYLSLRRLTSNETAAT